MKKISLIALFILYNYTLTFCQAIIEDYFQQSVNTYIKVELFDTENTLSAFESIEYTNNSNSKLDTIYFHLWPNAYHDLSTEYGKEKITYKDKKYVLNQSEFIGSIDSLNFMVDGEKIDFKIENDIAILFLKQSLNHNQTITITTPFRVRIPKTYSRLGHGENSFQISQWFPKPAVFDKNAWHPIHYRDLGEFYSEFGSYMVDITLPNKYILAATGNLVETKSTNTTTTYTYQEDSIHDFAWFADSQFKIEMDSVQLPYSNKWVTVKSYHYSNGVWTNTTAYIKDAIYFYSLWLGDYPYKTCKVVESDLGAGGGMEYPTITVIEGGEDISKIDLETVIMHEVGHNWFYGILGSNERDFPWMDEGLNSAYESRYIETKYPSLYFGLDTKMSKFIFPSYKSNFFEYLLSASRNIDQTSSLKSQQYNMINYETIVYKKNGIIFNYLRHYLGDEEFDRIMKIYFETWKFKHPQPQDFITVFQNNSEKYCSWLFEDLMSSRKKMDYKIKSIKKINQGYQLKIKNKSSISAPIFIELFKNDSLVAELKLEGFSKDTNFLLPHNFNKAYIDYFYKSPDINRNNNFIRTQGLLRKTEKLSFEFVGSQPKENITQIFYAPVCGFNTTNGFMLGSGFFNNLAFPSQFEYLLMPMYAFENNQLSGEVLFEYHFNSNSNFLKSITPYISSKSYGLNKNQNYFQSQLGIDFDFRNFTVSHPTYHLLNISYIIASQYFKPQQYNHFLNLKYNTFNKRWYNPFSIEADVKINKDFALLSAQIKQELTYSKPFTGLNIRFYTGVFIFNKSKNGIYNLNLSGTSGYQDYMYQSTLIGRNDNYNEIGAHQFVNNEGGFSLYAPFSSNQWMSSLTISSTLPIKTPFEFYYTLAAFEGSNNYFGNGLAWEMGISINIIRDMFIVYLPFTSEKLSEKQIRSTNALYTEKYIDKVRFTLLLNQWNIKKMSKNIDKLF